MQFDRLIRSRLQIAILAIGVSLGCAYGVSAAAQYNGADLARIAGEGNAERERVLCAVKDNVGAGLTAAEAAAALGELNSFNRLAAIRCLEPMLAQDFGGDDLVTLVDGGTAQRNTMLCAVKIHVCDGIRAPEVANALGQLNIRTKDVRNCGIASRLC